MRTLRETREFLHRIGAGLVVIMTVFPGLLGTIGGIIVFEATYWTSPSWAEKLPIWTHERAIARETAEHAQLVDAIVGTPLTASQLPEWTPIRVEQRFTSGLTIVSALGPHENFQYVVSGLAMPAGTTFRKLQGSVVRL